MGSGMTSDFAFLLAVGIAALCGAATGRIFALEGRDRRTSILAAGYCGAGAGILAAPTFGFVLVLIARLSSDTFVAAVARAAQATGPALLWGAGGGATGGLLVGLVVALIKTYTPH